MLTGVALAVTLALLGASCGTGTSDQGSSKDTVALNEKHSTLESEDDPVVGGKLVVAVPAETNGWNPTINQWADAGSIEGPSMIEPLLMKDADGNPEPWLAEKWDHNADFTQWDITVREGVTFHNGQPLDAAAVKKSLEATYQGGLTSIALASQYDHVEITGPRSVKVFLQHPWAQYPSSLNTAWMMAPEMLDRPDKGTVNPIGTGPFVFEEWVQNRYLRAKKFPNYWRKDKAGRQLPYLDEIEFRPIIDDDTKAKALQAGDVDVALTTSAQIATRLQDDFTVLRDYTSERTLIMLQTSEAEQNAPNPFTNIHARQAIAYATDRRSIADLVGENVEVTTQGYRPDSKWGLPESETGYPGFDQAKAREEIEAYKRDTGRSDLSFTLIGLTNLEDTTLMQALQAQWREVGITATLDNMDQVKYISILILGTWQAAWFRWYGYTNPDSNYAYNSSENANPIGKLSINFTHFHSDTMDKNLQIGRQTDDFATRRKANEAVIKEANEQAINIWLFDTPYGLIAKKSLHGLNGFRTHPFGNYQAKPWWGEAWVDK